MQQCELSGMAEKWEWLQIRLLREVLEWGQGMEDSMLLAAKQSESSLTVGQAVAEALSSDAGSGDEDDESENIIVLMFPEGDFKVVPKGTTAATLIQGMVSHHFLERLGLMVPQTRVMQQKKFLKFEFQNSKLWSSILKGLPHTQGLSIPEGSAAGCPVVNVNNLLVPEDTQLKNGDFVIRSRDLLQI